MDRESRRDDGKPSVRGNCEKATRSDRSSKTHFARVPQVRVFGPGIARTRNQLARAQPIHTINIRL